MMSLQTCSSSVCLSLQCCFIVGLPLGAVQRTGVNPLGRSSDRSTVDGVFSSEHTVPREIQSPVAAACLRQTAVSARANVETAVQPQLVSVKPESDVSGSRTGRQATRHVDTALSLDLSHSVTPTGNSHDKPPHQSHVQCPVKLNGISNTDKSADTCSGMCC